MSADAREASHDRGAAEQFWERHYQANARPWSGRAGAVLAGFAETVLPGTALDLGCSEGGDAVWLARRGWRVTAVDVSPTALARAAAHAAEAGVADRIGFQQHDLGRTFPAGAFDLVSAQYLQSPVALPRARVLRAAAAAVAPGGLLLVVEHASIAPWSWNQDPAARFPTAQEILAELDLTPDDWRDVFVGRPERQARGPGGQTATVADNVIAVRRLAA